VQSIRPEASDFTMAAQDPPRLTVGSLQGVPLGAVPQPGPIAPPAPARPVSEPAPDIEGPNWTVSAGEVSIGDGPRGTFFRPDGVEVLTFSNPFGQVMERVWFDHKVVYAIDLGKVQVDPNVDKVAQEYQIVYSVKLDEDGKLIGEAEMVDGQLNIYDTVPGMPLYSPIWQFNYVLVPRDYTPNTLRSESDCLASGYEILRSQVFEN
jgi:hypothetical protein